MWFILDIGSYFWGALPMPFVNFVWRLLDVFDGKFGAALRYMVIRKKLKECGRGVYFGRGIFIDAPAKVKIGCRVSIHHGCSILSKGYVEIGDDVSIAHGCSIVSGNHTWADESKPIKYNAVNLLKVTICDDVWVGCGVRILAGVIVGERTVIAANAVVNRSIDGGGIFGGIPARRLKEF